MSHVAYILSKQFNCATKYIKLISISYLQLVVYSARFKASGSTLTCTVKLTIYSSTCMSTLVALKNKLPLNNSYVYGFLNGSLISK